MFDRSDPRSSLNAATERPATVAAPRAGQLFVLDELEPDDVAVPGVRTWWVRSQNAIIAYSLVRAGAVLRRESQPDEFTVILSDPECRAAVSAGGETFAVAGQSIVVVPPGDSEIAFETDDRVVRLFSCRSADLAQRCRNAAAYAEPDANVRPFEPWPSPAGPATVRVYPLQDVPPDPARFGRIYRCATGMVNVFETERGPRSPERLSPHHHDDFEQISLQLEGDYVHHLRTPWGVRLAEWRDDEHLEASSPAILVIPPPLVHTTQAVGGHDHRLVDVFCPPRLDFSSRPGWVLNGEEYPLPAGDERSR